MEFLEGLYSLARRIVKGEKKVHYKNVDHTAIIGPNVRVVSPDYLYMEQNTSINGDAVIMNGKGGEFTIKKNSRIAVGLIVTCGNHMPVVGMLHREVTNEVKNKLDVNGDYTKPIIVNEDVWIGSRVILTQGVNVGRGAIVGAGSVVRTNVPPYAIVAGNPAKVVGFKFRPEQIIEHEIKLYAENERLSEDLLNKNYKKYFLDKLKEIRNFTNISL